MFVTVFVSFTSFEVIFLVEVVPESATFCYYYNDIQSSGHYIA